MSSSSPSPLASAPDAATSPSGSARDPIEWGRTLPFVGVHLACLAVFFVGVSWIAVAVAVLAYGLRMFAITGFYHRYFSHRTFKTHRVTQFLFGVLGSTAGQRGPLWWAAHHRHHHRHADTDRDRHSPRLHGFLFSHMGWFWTPSSRDTDLGQVKDLARHRELVALDRHSLWCTVALGFLVFGLGWVLEVVAPQLGTGRWQMFVWGYLVSTVVLYHATYTINSLAHTLGKRRFETRDDSRNNWFLALLTLGEGWHNNHHHYPAAARQGFYWWEVDLTYYGLWLLARLGIIWDLRPVPARVLERGRVRTDSLASTRVRTGEAA